MNQDLRKFVLNLRQKQANVVTDALAAHPAETAAARQIVEDAPIPSRQDAAIAGLKAGAVPAGVGAVVGAGIGALTNEDKLKGIIKGALIGGATAGSAGAAYGAGKGVGNVDTQRALQQWLLSQFPK